MKKLLLSMMMLGATVMLKAQNPYPILPIDSVQFVNQTKLSNPTANTLPDYVDPVKQNLTHGDTVRFEGIVISNPKIYGLSTSRKAGYIQRKGGGPWSGALVMCEPSGSGLTLPQLNAEAKFYDNFIVGYKVRVTGVIRDFQGETQINLIRNNVDWDNSVEQVSLTPDTLVYTQIQANELMTGNPNTTWVQQKTTAEQYEGTLVTISNVSVYSIQQSGNRTFWSVIDDFGNVLDVRDMSAYFRRDDNEDTVPKVANTFQPPVIGTRLEYIRGVVTEYAANGVQRYGIIPISPSDVGPCNVCPPKILNITQTPTVANSTDSVTISATITSDTAFSSVTLNYNGTGTNVFTSVNMVETAIPDLWAAKIPPFPANTVVKYFTKAIDGRNLRTVIPDTLATNSNYLVTNSGIDNIRTLQYSASSSGASIWDGDSLLNIDVRGIVTGTTFGSMLTVQDGTGPNSAIFIQKGTNGTVNNWKVGDSVQITRATVGETFNTTNLYNILGSVITSGNPLPAMQTGLSLDSFALNRVGYSRKYEGVLMRFDSVKVNNVNPDAPSDFGEFAIIYKNSVATTGLRIDDLSANFKGLNKRVKVGMVMGYIEGPMYFANGNFKLIPSSMDDIDLTNLDSVAPVITLLGANPDTVDVGSGAYADAGATAMDNLDGDISANIVVTGAVNTSAIGMYLLKYKVMDAWGNADSAMRTVLVVDTMNVGVNENEMNFAQLAVYPNPASSYITVSGSFVKTQPITITVVDILGKVVSTRIIRGTQFNETLSTENLNNGVYFCTISNASGSKTLKFMVSGK